MDVECDPHRMDQLKRMLKREVQDFEVVPSQSGDEFPPPTPLSAAASFGNVWCLFIYFFYSSSKFKNGIKLLLTVQIFFVFL